ncbi:MAG: IS3 family transposase [Nitrosomonas sp.]|nr:IS3 family transposase [Nitrosomonas sp.]
MKELFIQSRQSYGSRRLMKALRKEGFKIGRCRVRSLMKRLGIVVKKKKRFVITTDSRHNFPVAENHLDRQFQPASKNQAWASDITYLWTTQGWVYLAVVIDLYSRRVVGWHCDKRMTQSLVIRALMMAINLRPQTKGLLHHSDRGSQYASHAYQKLLKQHGIICSMSRKGNCWDNAPTERFFSSLKREWLTGNTYATREAVINDVNSYMKFYNQNRLHSTINDMSPINYEKCS